MATHVEPAFVGDSRSLVQPHELEAGVNLIMPNLKEMERRITSLTQQVADLKSSLAMHATNAAFNELKEQVALKGNASDLSQTNVQIDIVRAKCEQKADLARLRELDEQCQALLATAMTKDEKFALERRMTSLEDRFDSTSSSTSALVKQLQASDILQKDALAAVEQRCVFLEEDASRLKVQTATIAQISTKVQAIADLANTLASNLQQKADKASIESWGIQIADLNAQLPLKADRNEVDRLSLLLNGLNEGLLVTVQQKVAKDIAAERERIQSTHILDRTVADKSITDFNDNLEKRFEQFKASFTSGLFCEEWAESFRQAWMSKINLTETTLLSKLAGTDANLKDLQSRLEEMATRLMKTEALTTDKSFLIDELSKVCAGKSSQTALDSLAQACANKAECKRVDELSALCSSKASQLDVERCMSLCNSKADRANVDDLAQRCASKTSQSELEKCVSSFESKVDLASQTCKDTRAIADELAAKAASHESILRNTDVMRFVFLNVIEVLGIRFVPDHTKVMDMIRGGVGYGDAHELAGAFSATWQPYSQQNESDTATARTGFDATSTRVGGGFRYPIAPKVRPLSARLGTAARRHQETLFQTRPRDVLFT